MGHPAGLLDSDLDLEPGRLEARELPPRLVQHLKALRPRRGERYSFMNGQGRLWPATVIEDRLLVFEVAPGEDRSPLKPRIALCLAPPKGDDLWQALTQATEVGAARVHFLRSDHAQIAKAQNVPVERARRVADAACEQCARPWRLEIDEAWQRLDALLARPGIHVVADEALADESEAIGFVDGVPGRLDSQDVYLYVGPEGGWSDGERELFRGRALRLSLGNLVLRVPTACVAGLHFLRLVSEQQSGP